MDEALFALLTGSAAVAALCADRVFWGVAPAGTTLPRLVLNIISGADTPHLGGTDGLWRYRVQIDCYATHRPGALALSRAVVGLLNGYRDTAFRGVFIATSREEKEDAALGRPSRFSHDFNVTWRG